MPTNQKQDRPALLYTNFHHQTNAYASFYFLPYTYRGARLFQYVSGTLVAMINGPIYMGILGFVYTIEDTLDSNPDSDHLSHVDCDPDSNPDSGTWCSSKRALNKTTPPTADIG